MYWVTQKLPQMYNANHATFPIQISKITVQICGNFWVAQYHACVRNLTQAVFRSGSETPLLYTTLQHSNQLEAFRCLVPAQLAEIPTRFVWLRRYSYLFV